MKFLLICAAIALFKLCYDGVSGNEWWILEGGLALAFFIAAAIVSSVRYDQKMLKDDPSHFTTGDAVKTIGLWYLVSWLFRDKTENM